MWIHTSRAEQQPHEAASTHHFFARSFSLNGTPCATTTPIRIGSAILISPSASKVFVHEEFAHSAKQQHHIILIK